MRNVYLIEAVQDTRILLNDTTESVWTNKQITYYLNEAISIVKKNSTRTLLNC